MGYPRTLQEFQAAFPDEEAYWRALRRARWPEVGPSMSVIRELGLELQKRLRKSHPDSLLGSQNLNPLCQPRSWGGANRIGRGYSSCVLA